jgi:hypothetical protein
MKNSTRSILLCLLLLAANAAAQSLETPERYRTVSLTNGEKVTGRVIEETPEHITLQIENGKQLLIPFSEIKMLHTAELKSKKMTGLPTFAGSRKKKLKMVKTAKLAAKKASKEPVNYENGSESRTAYTPGAVLVSATGPQTGSTFALNTLAGFSAGFASSTGWNASGWINFQPSFLRTQTLSTPIVSLRVGKEIATKDQFALSAYARSFYSAFTFYGGGVLGLTYRTDAVRIMFGTGTGFANMNYHSYNSDLLRNNYAYWMNEVSANFKLDDTSELFTESMLVLSSFTSSIAVNASIGATFHKSNLYLRPSFTYTYVNTQEARPAYWLAPGLEIGILF